MQICLGTDAKLKRLNKGNFIVNFGECQLCNVRLHFSKYAIIFSLGCFVW